MALSVSILRYKRHDAMTQDERKPYRKSSLDTLIEELDEINTRLGLPKPEWGEPDPTRHRMIVKMPRQKSSGPSEK